MGVTSACRLFDGSSSCKDSSSICDAGICIGSDRDCATQDMMSVARLVYLAFLRRGTPRLGGDDHPYLHGKC